MLKVNRSSEINCQLPQPLRNDLSTYVPTKADPLLTFYQAGKLHDPFSLIKADDGAKYQARVAVPKSAHNYTSRLVGRRREESPQKKKKKKRPEIPPSEEAARIPAEAVLSKKKINEMEIRKETKGVTLYKSSVEPELLTLRN